MTKANAIKTLESMQNKVIVRNGHENILTIAFCLAVEIAQSNLTDDIKKNNIQVKAINKLFQKA